MESNRNIDFEFGNFIYSIINHSRYTYSEIAEFLGVSDRMIGYYCSGEKKPNSKRLLKMLKFLNVSPQDIPF